MITVISQIDILCWLFSAMPNTIWDFELFYCELQKYGICGPPVVHFRLSAPLAENSSGALMSYGSRELSEETSYTPSRVCDFGQGTFISRRLYWYIWVGHFETVNWSAISRISGRYVMFNCVRLAAERSKSKSYRWFSSGHSSTVHRRSNAAAVMCVLLYVNHCIFRPTISSSLRSLILGLLQKDPGLRILLPEIKVCFLQRLQIKVLQKVWFAKIKVRKVRTVF